MVVVVVVGGGGGGELEVLLWDAGVSRKAVQKCEKDVPSHKTALTLPLHG